MKRVISWFVDNSVSANLLMAVLVIGGLLTLVSIRQEEFPAIDTEVIPVEDLATYYGWVGDAEKSLEWVLRAYELSPSGVEPRVIESALFERVREDPRFRRGVDRVRSGIWDRVRAQSGS